jgi:hypothetical protein
MYFPDPPFDPAFAAPMRDVEADLPSVGAE